LLELTKELESRRSESEAVQVCGLHRLMFWW